MGNQKKAIDLAGLSKGIQERFDSAGPEVKLGAMGIAGDSILEPVPEFINTESEKVISGKNNSWIILGRDRPADRLSGYGGKGDTQCGMIDFVVGRMGANPRAVDDTGERMFVDPDFFSDAARIYISQKTDVDDNFVLADGKVGNFKTRSAVALKADAIRIIGREGIKLITRTDKKNSQGADVIGVQGIDLIAGNDSSDIQPMLKGDNTVECIDRLATHLDKLNGIVDHLLMTQMMMNEAVTHHTHFSPFFGMATTTSVVVESAGQRCMLEHLNKTKKSLVAHKINLVNFKYNYLKPIGKGYINSRYNNVN